MRLQLTVSLDLSIDQLMGSFLGGESTSDQEKTPIALYSPSEVGRSTESAPFSEEPGCCGMASGSNQKESEVWRADFQSSCNKLRQHFKWADVIRKAGVEKMSTRTDNMKEFNELKYQFSRKLQNKEVPNSIEMKKLLNFSALLEENVGDDGREHSNSLVSKSSLAKSMRSSIQNPGKFKGRPNHLMVSIFQENMKTLFTPKKTPLSKIIDEQIESSIYLFVKFTELLEKQSQDPNNAICRIRLAFINYIRENYGNLRTPTQQQDQEITNSIRAFIDLYTITINVYYRVPTLSQNEKTRYIFSIENIKSVATVILFKHDKFYQMVFQLYELRDRVETENLKVVIDEKKALNPQDLKVNDEYCCNQLTLNWHLKRASLERNELNDIDIPIHQEGQPFETCIIKLKQIEEGQTPISKLKVVISTAEKITSSISRFYEINGIASTQLVDSDQVLTIFIYIILKAGVPNLRTHLRFIENFCTQEQLLSETGYYSKVAESALKLLIEDIDDF